MLESQWVWQCTKSVNIPAEEQNAGLIVDYFYRMEFHITPRFFSDSNYLFFLNFFSPFLGNGAMYDPRNSKKKNGVGGAKEEVAFLNVHTHTNGKKRGVSSLTYIII